MTRFALTATLVLLLVAAAGCGSSSHSQAQPQRKTNPSPSTSVAGTSQLTDLRDIQQLRSLFNTRSGEPRLIVLVSPT